VNLHLKSGDYSAPTIEAVRDYGELLDEVDFDFNKADPNLKGIRTLGGLIKRIKGLGEPEAYSDSVKATSYAYGYSTDISDPTEDLCLVLRLTNLKKLALEDISKSQLASHISYESHILEVKDAQYLFEMVWEE